MFYKFSPDFLRKILTKKFTFIRRVKEIFYVNNFYRNRRSLSKKKTFELLSNRRSLSKKKTLELLNKYKKIKIEGYGRGLMTTENT